LPAFADNEIDQFVDEVQESAAPEAPAPEEGGEAMVAEPPVVEEAEETMTAEPPGVKDAVEDEEAVFEIDADALSLEGEAPEPEVAATPPEVDEPPAEADEPEVESSPQFEVDHKVEPEWPDQQETAAAIEDTSTEDDTQAKRPAVDYEAVLEALRRSPEAEEPDQAVPDQVDAEQPEVTLTDVVGDQELFEDPSLDIARMAAGQEREILIPVELKQEDAEPRRFKLSIKLRLDKVD
jgi:hypothetical protein